MIRGRRTEQDIERNSFMRGYNQIRSLRKGRALSVLALDEISQGLKAGGMSDASMKFRKYGYVEHTPVEREFIEKVFKKYGVNDPWGTK